MKKRSKRWDAARMMPPLRHSTFGQEYDISSSVAARWLSSQPEIMQLIFDSVRDKEIVYDPETGTWRGVDYDN